MDPVEIPLRIYWLTHVQDSVPKFLKEPRFASILQEHDFEKAVASAKYTPAPPPERSISKLGRQ